MIVAVIDLVMLPNRAWSVVDTGTLPPSSVAPEVKVTSPYRPDRTMTIADGTVDFSTMALMDASSAGA